MVLWARGTEAGFRTLSLRKIATNSRQLLGLSGLSILF
jgi:hypothetical protein